MITPRVQFNVYVAPAVIGSIDWLAGINVTLENVREENF